MKDDLYVALHQAKASSFMIVDYVWPWVGGRWGYSQWDIAAYREALNGTDGGLTVVDSHGEKNLGFWEYFAELSGLRLAPHEVGCESWDEYVPARAPDVETNPADENRRTFFLFYGLYHHCWLRFAQECGQYAESLGGELQASLNPENFANGTDILTWGRLKTTGEPWLEEWATAWIAIAGYHNLWYFARPYRQAGKRLGLIGETCAGGGGHPPIGGPGYAHYWDPPSNYAITYALGAAGQFNDREEDYVWTSWAEMSDPSRSHWDCWRGYKAAMDGFWQYALDGPRRPQCEVLSIVNRSVLHHAGASEYETKLDYTLSAPLINLHYDYHQGYFPLDEETLDQHRVILFSQWEYPRDFAMTLHRWLQDKPGRVLVTHSFVPARPCKGLHQDPYPELDKPRAAETFGLHGLHQTRLREGKITYVAPCWREFFELEEGTEVSLPQEIVHCDGRALVKLNDHNLVTEVTTANGSRIVYLNFAPPRRYKGPEDNHSALHRACLHALLREEEIPPQAYGAPHWACARYDLDHGHAYLLLDAKALDQERLTEESSTRPRTDPLHLVLRPNTSYVIYDLLQATTAVKKADPGGRLPVHLSGKNVRLLHVIPERTEPFVVFTECERTDEHDRWCLPAQLYAHRASRLVIGGLSPDRTVLVDGQPAQNLSRTPGFDVAELTMLPRDHDVAVR